MMLYFNNENLNVIHEQTEVMKTQTEIQNQERMPKFEIEKQEELDSRKYIFKNKGGYVSNFQINIIDKLNFNTESFSAGIFDKMYFQPVSLNDSEWMINIKKDLQLYQDGYKDILMENGTPVENNMMFANRYFQIKFNDYTNTGRIFYYEENYNEEIIYKEKAEEAIVCDNLNVKSYYEVMIGYGFGDDTSNWSKERYTDQVVQLTYDWLTRMLKEGMSESPDWTCEKRIDSFFF